MKNSKIKLIHISTDFVFDGLKTQPYNETDETNPISVYGGTKLKGETEIKQILKNFFILSKIILCVLDKSFSNMLL